MPHSPDATFARPIWRVIVGAVALVGLPVRGKDWRRTRTPG